MGTEAGRKRNTVTGDGRTMGQRDIGTEDTRDRGKQGSRDRGAC